MDVWRKVVELYLLSQLFTILESSIYSTTMLREILTENILRPNDWLIVQKEYSYSRIVYGTVACNFSTCMILFLLTASVKIDLG